jgi:hypothetical protein
MPRPKVKRMRTELEPILGVRYSASKVIEGLTVLARLAGNSSQASRVTGVSHTTLDDWRRRFPNRYADVADRLAQAVEADVIRDTRELAARLSETEFLALQRTHEKLEQGNDKEPATTLRNLAVTKGIQIDKNLVLTGRPTQISESRDAAELIKAIRARVTILDGEAEEEPEAA